MIVRSNYMMIIIVTDVLFCARFCHTWMYITYELPIECTWILMIPMTGRSPNSSNSPLDSKFTSLKLQPQLRFILQHQTRILTPYIRREKKKNKHPLDRIILSSSSSSSLSLHPLCSRWVTHPLSRYFFRSHIPPTFSPLISLGFQQQNSDNEFWSTY